MDVATHQRLLDWLQTHNQSLVARWHESLRQRNPIDADRYPDPERLSGIVQILTSPDESGWDRHFAILAEDFQGLGLPALLQIIFELRRASIDELSDQGWSLNDINGVMATLEPHIERAVASLAAAVSAHAEGELGYLLQQQGQMAAESDQMALQLSALYEISQALNASLDRKALLDTIGPQLLQAFDIDHCALLLRSSDERWVVERAWGKSWQKIAAKEWALEQLPKGMREAIDENHLVYVAQPKAADGPWLQAKRGVLFVPLIHDDHALGALAVQGNSLRSAFDPGSSKLWSTVANQIVASLQNVLLYQELQTLNTDLEKIVAERTFELREERDRLEAIADIARDISTLEIDVLLNRILQALANLTGVIHGSVMLIDSGTGLLVDRAVLSETDHMLGSRRFQIGEGIVGWIAQHRQPALVNDVENDERWVTLDAFGQLVGKNTGALVGVPLIAGDDVVGVLMLSHPQAHYFNQSHLRLLKAIAGEIAIAIYNAQLYEFLGERTNRLYTMLRHQEEVSSQNNAILQSLNDAVIVVNTDRNVILANAAAERLLGKPIDELVTQTFDDLIESLNLRLPGDPLSYVLQRAANGDKVQTEPLNINWGTQVLNVSMGPVVTERGELLGACLIGRDITREVESDRLKTEFIGTVSHELRTPMTSIKGYTQLLAMGSLGEVNDTQKEFLNTITTNAERMIAIINDLLDITKIETGSVDLNITPLRVADLLGAAVSAQRQEITQKQHDFSLTMKPNLPLVVGDQERLHQVFSNVLSNAIKYTPQGGKITLSAALADLEAVTTAQLDGLNRQRPYVQISVQDSGVGIDPSEHDRIFERFYRTENQLKIEAGGTGLGLSLVKPLLQLMGGRIWVESEVDKGSTFHMLLPANTE